MYTVVLPTSCVYLFSSEFWCLMSSQVSHRPNIISIGQFLIHEFLPWHSFLILFQYSVSVPGLGGMAFIIYIFLRPYPIFTQLIQTLTQLLSCFTDRRFGKSVWDLRATSSISINHFLKIDQE